MEDNPKSKIRTFRVFPYYLNVRVFFHEDNMVSPITINMKIWIESNRGVLFYEYVIATTNPSFIDEQFIDNEAFNTHEEAELACLKKLIEIVKQ